jgi:hypothetical protein
MDQEPKGFKVTDRRGITPDDEADKRESRGEEQPTRTQEPEEEVFSTTLNFSTFILSLTTSVLVSLGELPDPITKEEVSNLPLARQTIGIIEILKEKTTGNLSEEEDRLINTVLYDLRMKYVTSASA